MLLYKGNDFACLFTKHIIILINNLIIWPDLLYLKTLFPEKKSNEP